MTWCTNRVCDFCRPADCQGHLMLWRETGMCGFQSERMMMLGEHPQHLCMRVTKSDPLILISAAGATTHWLFVCFFNSQRATQEPMEKCPSFLYSLSSKTKLKEISVSVTFNKNYFFYEIVSVLKSLKLSWNISWQTSSYWGDTQHDRTYFTYTWKPRWTLSHELKQFKICFSNIIRFWIVLMQLKL